MDPKTVQFVLSLLQVALATGPTVVEDVIKVKAMLQQSPDIQANLKQLFDDTIATDTDTINKANAWLTANGFAPIPVP